MKRLNQRFPSRLLAGAPPELGPGPRPGVLSEREADQAIDQPGRDAKLTGERLKLARSLILLWHDHLDAAHSLAQGNATADGSYLHGLVHRREADYDNARYWFRRTGVYGAFPEITRRVAAVLREKKSDALARQLIPQAGWQPVAFVDACERAAGRPNAAGERETLQEIQRAEFTALLEYILAPGSPPGNVCPPRTAPGPGLGRGES